MIVHHKATGANLMTTEQAPSAMKIGGKYNWRGQKERLIYLGKKGVWHQFNRIGDPRDVWCEVPDSDLHMIEETKDAEQAPRELSDAQIQEIAHKDEFWFAHSPNAFCYTPFARAVIAADRALVASQAQPAEPGTEPMQDDLAKKLVELADELDAEADSGSKWHKAQHTCVSVGGTLRDVARQVDEQIYHLVRALREAIETPVLMELAPTGAGEPTEPRQDSGHSVESSAPPAAALGQPGASE